MSDRAPGGQPSPPANSGRTPEEPPPFAGIGLVGCLVSLLRLSLLAVAFVGTLVVVNAFLHSASLSRRVDAPAGSTYLAVALAAICAVLMIALLVDTAFLLGRWFSRRVAGYLLVAILALGTAAIAVGFLGSAKLGSTVIGLLVIPTVTFALGMLLVPNLFRRFPPPPTRRQGAAPPK